MPIELVTGLPGAGKSLGMVERMLTWRERDASRPVFVLGVDGLADGVGQAITPEDLTHWFDYPAGSIFVIDEAQKYFPMRRAGDPPAWVRRLSEHRHLGHDFVLATQAPGYLDTYLRGLVDRHVHLVRKFGAHVADWYEWGAVCMSPLSPGERKRATHRLWAYPKRCFEFYKSAELHTVKRRIPKKLIVLLVAPLLLLGTIFAVPMVMKHGEKVPAPGQTTAQGLLPQSTVASLSGGEKIKYATPEAYVQSFLPRVANQPWSAPAYDNDAIRSRPDLICIEYENPRKDGEMLCGCYTEQITPYRLGSLNECRRYARHGVYNPHRAPPENVARSSVDATSGSASRNAQSASALQGRDDWQPEWRTRSYVQPERTQTRGVSGSGGVGAQPPR